jgi:hypothetical protein
MSCSKAVFNTTNVQLNIPCLLRQFVLEKIYYELTVINMNGIVQFLMTEHYGLQVMLQICIQEVLGLTLFWDTGYSE